jgi:hypothetical protein
MEPCSESLSEKRSRAAQAKWARLDASERKEALRTAREALIVDDHVIPWGCDHGIPQSALRMKVYSVASPPC